MDRRQLAPGLLPASLAAIDVTLTLAGQPSAYWAGDFGAAYELNPIGLVLLQAHPLGFAVAGLGWAIGLAWAVARLPGPSAPALAFVATLGHAVGGASWLWRAGAVGAAMAVAYLLAAERLLGLAWRSAGWRT